MKFAAPIWLWGIALAGLVIALFIYSALTSHKLRNKFGHEAQVLKLLTAQAPLRKALQNALLAISLILLSLAAAQPQYGKGTRILPKTNLDVAIVLDYSKSMYARDVSPSRIGRAKVEVENLIRKLGGARFAGVAFAGESLAFPLTSDGAAIAQFFRGLTPHDMPVGGTAIARALEEALGLFSRDSRAKGHEKVVLLVTDGEDLEGDPRISAEKMSLEGIRIEVVQIGGQSPEPLPNIDENGAINGLRRDASGRIMTTSLSVEGEETLQALASLTGGQLVHSGQGSLGIDEMARRLRLLMSEELSEKVETVFADVYQYPLALALLLLLLESVFLRLPRTQPSIEPPKKGRRSSKKQKAIRTTNFSLLFLCVIFLSGCDRGREFFIRQSPVVNEAIEAMTDERNEVAVELLTQYLETGPCEAGIIGAGDRSRTQGDAALDLALALIEEPEPGEQASPRLDCGLRLLSQVALSEEHPAGLRAASHYLMGNLNLRKADFDAAIESYDASLRLMPGGSEQAKDEPIAIGNRAAYNRALAQRLKEAQPPEEENEQKDDSDDGEKDQPEDGEKDDSEDGEKDQPEDDDSEDGNSQDKSAPRDAQREDREEAARNERLLDEFEQAPTLQQEQARARARRGRRRSSMEDK